MMNGAFAQSAESPQPLAVAPAAALPAEAAALFREGVARLQSGEGKEAVTALTRAVDCAPAFPCAHVFLGLACALTADIYPALDHLEYAAQQEPDNFAAHFFLAQLHFKLRIPRKAYVEAERARRCVRTLEQRKMLSHLLSAERAREREGIARPWFNKPFGASALLVAGSGLCAAAMALLLLLR